MVIQGPSGHAGPLDDLFNRRLGVAVLGEQLSGDGDEELAGRLCLAHAKRFDSHAPILQTDCQSVTDHRSVSGGGTMAGARGSQIRLPNAEHTTRPWRIHELTGDFRLEDVWALPAVGGPDDFPRLVHLIAGSDPSQSSSFAVRTLFP